MDVSINKHLLTRYAICSQQVLPTTGKNYGSATELKSSEVEWVHYIKQRSLKHK